MRMMMRVMLVNTYDSDETLSQNGYAMGASAMMTMMMTPVPPRCPQHSTGLFVICNPTLATEPDFAMLAYAPQRQEPVTPVTPRLIQQVCPRESFRKNLGKDFLVAA